MSLPLSDAEMESIYKRSLNSSTERGVLVLYVRLLHAEVRRQREVIVGLQGLSIADDSITSRLEAKIKQQQREIMDLRTELNRERSQLNDERAVPE